MRDHLVRTVFLCIFCILTVKVHSMEATFKGSADEVKSQLYSVFSLGTEKSEVISISKSKFDIEEEEIRSYDYGSDPLVLEQEGKKLDVYSWVEMDIANYRSLKKLFIKTTVTAKFFFDEQEKLIGIDVTLYGDSL